LNQFAVEGGAVTGVTYGGDRIGIVAATSLGDITVRPLSAAGSPTTSDQNKSIAKVKPSERGKTSVAASSDGRFIAAGSDYDDAVGNNNRVWEASTKRSWPLQTATRIVSLDFGEKELVVGASENGW